MKITYASSTAPTSTREEYDGFTMPLAGAQAAADAGETVEDPTDPKPVELTEADGKKQLIGYAVVWGAVSDVRRDGFRHRYARGSIRWAEVVNALWAHLLGSPLGSTANGTLTVVEDDYGAKATIDLDDTTDGTNTYIRVKNKLVTGMSFGGTRLAFKKSGTPKVIDVTSFIADEVSITIAPGMIETHIVTAENSDGLEKQKATQQQNMKLEKIKLAMLKPSRVFGK